MKGLGVHLQGVDWKEGWHCWGGQKQHLSCLVDSSEWLHEGRHSYDTQCTGEKSKSLGFLKVSIKMLLVEQGEEHRSWGPGGVSQIYLLQKWHFFEVSFFFSIWFDVYTLLCNIVSFNIKMVLVVYQWKPTNFQKNFYSNYFPRGCSSFLLGFSDSFTHWLYLEAKCAPI